MTQEDSFLHNVRLLQRKTKCSNTVCDEFVRLFHQYRNKNTGRGLKTYDTKAKRAAKARTKAKAKVKLSAKKISGRTTA